MQVRTATPEDAMGIAIVHVDTWRTTYEGIIPSEFLQALSYEKRKLLWDQNIADKSNKIFVVENSEAKIIGFAVVAKREENKVVGATDLTSLYLLKEYQGSGIGKLLMQHVFKHCSAIQATKVFVEVLADNNTRHFYEYYGAQFVEMKQLNIGGNIINEAIYVWEDVAQTLSKLSN